MRFLIVIVLFSNTILSQNLEQHQWKNRIIVISGSKVDSSRVETQFNQFKNKKNELRERKLVVYKCIGNTCKYYNWVNKPETFMVKNLSKRFSVELIGLDGTKKYESSCIVEAKNIFDLIDTMPMRRRELKKKQ